MRELCRVQSKVSDCGSVSPVGELAELATNAVWIIIDDKRHIATGAARYARDINRIDIADVLSVYLEDCGSMADQPKLERCIGA